MLQKNSDIKVFAQNYLDKGWSIVPVEITTKLEDGKIKKIPRFPTNWGQWEREAMKKDEIGRYWPQFSGIAIATGKISGITVIDIDVHDLPEMNKLPPTYTVKTRNGYHFFYQYSKDIKQTQNNQTHIDIRNDGGLIFASPTKYKLPNGEEVGYSISQELPIAPFPVGWYEDYQKVNEAILKSKGIATKGVESIISGVGLGSRNNSAASVAGSLLLRYPQRDWQSLAWPLFCSWNAQNSPPLSSQEITVTWNSICSKEKARQLSGSTLGEPIIVEIPGGWSVNFTHSDGLIYFNFTNFENGSGRKEATVSILVEKKNEKSGLPLTERFNLISVNARGAVVTQLNSSFGKEFKWSLLLSNAIEYFLTKQNIIQSVEVDFSVPYKETPFLLFPFVEENSINMLFGDGDVGKTMMTMKIGLCVAFDRPFLDFEPSVSAQTNKNVLFIDYENNENTYIMRCKALMPGLSNTDLKSRMFYFGGQMPLHEHEEHLHKIIYKHNIGLILIDSAAAACGGAAEDSVTANRFINLLRRLKVASFVIAHQSKGADGKSPFGSIFWRNGCRNIWYAKRNDESYDPGIIDVLLRHNKANNFQRQRDQFAQIEFNKSTNEDLSASFNISVKTGDKRNWESELNIKERVLLLLEDGSMTVQQICDETDIKKNTITVTLKRFLAKGMVEKNGENWKKVVQGKYLEK